MLTKEEKEKMYNQAVETLTNAFAEFYKENENDLENEIDLIKAFCDEDEKEKDFDLIKFWQQIQKLTNSALEWESDLLKVYTLLKRIENWTKLQADKLKDFAYSQYVDRGYTAKDEIAYWYWFAITTRTTIKYDEDKEYAEINEKLKARESILKNAVEQNKKGNTVVDENGEIMNVPTYWFSSSLTIKKI